MLFFTRLEFPPTPRFRGVFQVTARKGGVQSLNFAVASDSAEELVSLLEGCYADIRNKDGTEFKTKRAMEQLALQFSTVWTAVP